MDSKFGYPYAAPASDSYTSPPPPYGVNNPPYAPGGLLNDTTNMALVPSNYLSVARPQSSAPTPTTQVAEDHVRSQIYYRLVANPQQLEIRLIEIEPQDDSMGRMSCIIRQTPLDYAPEYYALSYYWGEANGERKVILVNGLEFRIQLNLWDALHALRRRGCTTVWADAICLDQEDDEEKAQQVPRMKMIYQRAKGVAIWLGREADGSTEVIDMLRRLARTDVSRTWNEMVQSNLPEMEEVRSHVAMSVRKEYLLEIVKILLAKEELVESDLLDDEVKQVIEAFDEKLQAFFRRPFWRRVWIIQEVSVGRSVAIFCGDELLKWADLDGTMILEDSSVDWDDVSEVGARSVDLIIKLRYKIKNSIPIGLLTALQYSCGFEAGREQDKIYGLLGLAWDAERYVQTVSYARERTLARIMFDMSMLWMNSGFLDIICLQPLARYNDLSLPSWFPKWVTVGKGTLSNRLIDFLENRKKVAFLPKFHHRWTATARVRSMYHQLLDDNRVLAVRGIHVDTIDGLSGTCSIDLKDEELNKSWDSKNTAPVDVAEMKRIRQDLYWTLCMYKADEAQGIADQTLNLDFLYAEEIRSFLTQEELDPILKWFDELLNFKIFGRQFALWLRKRPKYRNDLKIIVLNKLIKNMGDRNDPNQHSMLVIDALKQVFDDGRRLMTTRTGRIGWAHPSARPGDRIYLIEGCNLPVILAPCNVPCDGYQTCQVVGDAYVHGVMYGELWAQASTQLTKIFLR